MLPPVLEIYVAWHPADGKGREIAEEFVEHFHGTVFSGLIGGAVEVYVRSDGWQTADDAPRPIPFSDGDLPAGIQNARFVAVVPILGTELAAATENRSSPWVGYLQEMLDSQKANEDRIGIFPYLLDKGATDQTVLGRMIGHLQQIAAGNPRGDDETERTLRCRDLAQGIAQLLMAPRDQRLTVFISHTKRHSATEGENVDALVAAVRDVISHTRLQDFFDASDLQPGQDWDAELRKKAATSALLAIRTDLYPSREWCQREVAIAKREGMPVVTMDALGSGEERGSFLMDHVPRVPARTANGMWRKADIRKALNLLVDESLKRVLWLRQAELASKELGLDVAWWAPQAPEPITLMNWLSLQIRNGKFEVEGEDIVVLHPDPPLGAEEKATLQEILFVGRINRNLDVMTPRLLAARGA